MTESALLARIRLAVGRLAHARLFRNQVGEAWIGDVARRDAASGTVTLLKARRVPFGLAPGSADLVGWTTVTITPDMVGQRVAVFTSAEVKAEKGRVRLDQENWRRVVAEAGGRAGIVRSVEGAVALVATP